MQGLRETFSQTESGEVDRAVVQRRETIAQCRRTSSEGYIRLRRAGGFRKVLSCVSVIVCGLDQCLTGMA